MKYTQISTLAIASVVPGWIYIRLEASNPDTDFKLLYDSDDADWENSIAESEALIAVLQAAFPDYKISCVLYTLFGQDVSGDSVRADITFEII